MILREREALPEFITETGGIFTEAEPGQRAGTCSDDSRFQAWIDRRQTRFAPST